MPQITHNQSDSMLLIFIGGDLGWPERAPNREFGEGDEPFATETAQHGGRTARADEGDASAQRCWP